MDFIDLGPACLIAAPFACVYAAVAAIAGARRPESDRRLRRLVAAGDLRALPAAHDQRGRDSRRRSCAPTSRLPWSPITRRRPRRSATSDRDVVEPGRLAAALGVGAVDRLERGPLSDPQPPPRGRPLGDRGARRHRPVLRRADAARRRRREPVHPPRPGARRGRRPHAAAAPPGDGDPPADALLRLRLLLDPVRLRDRGADHPPRGRELDPLDPALRARRLDAALGRHPARRPLVLLRARLGRLLGVGRGRERVADAVAGRHRLPALGHGPGEARDAAGLERVADRRHLQPRAARHLPGPLRDPAVDPRLRRVDRRRRRCWG